MKKLKKRLTADELFSAFDMFGSEAPHITLEGKPKIGSLTGFLMTLFVIGVMIAFGILQIHIVKHRVNPLISMAKTQEAFTTSDDTLNNSEHFFWAFSVMHTITKEVLYDEGIVRFQGLVSEGDGVDQYMNL